MAKIIVLGGCGVVGSIAVRNLITFPEFSEVVIGDINTEKAQEVAKTIGDEKIQIRKVDALDPNSLKSAMKDFDIVLNCIGPFYRFAPLILKAAIAAGKNYVDVNDDVDATIEVLKMDEYAKQANITALIGMGSSPGVSNLLVKFAADHFLDEMDSIDLYHAHGGEPVEGPGVVFHRIHSMSIDIPVFIDGKLKTVNFFGDDGKALEEDIDFKKLGEYHCHPYPHPEIITFPKYFKGLKRVTNKGTVIPPQYFYLITEIVRLGLTDEKPIEVKGNMISPLDFAISYIINQRERILKETNFGIQRGCLKIVIKGKKGGKPHQYVFSLASRGLSMGEGTGIPAAIGALLITRNLVTEKGVLPPEACVNPLKFLGIMQELLKLDSATGEGSPLIIESIDEKGNVETISI